MSSTRRPRRQSERRQLKGKNWVRFAKKLPPRSPPRLSHRPPLYWGWNLRARHLPYDKIWVRFVKNGIACSYLFGFGGFHMCTPGLPLFSSMNSMPAADALISSALFSHPETRPQNHETIELSKQFGFVLPKLEKYFQF
jgi:hypothetical protein